MIFRFKLYSACIVPQTKLTTLQQFRTISPSLEHVQFESSCFFEDVELTFLDSSSHCYTLPLYPTFTLSVNTSLLPAPNSIHFSIFQYILYFKCHNQCFKLFRIAALQYSMLCSSSIVYDIAYFCFTCGNSHDQIHPIPITFIHFILAISF